MRVAGAPWRVALDRPAFDLIEAAVSDIDPAARVERDGPAGLTVRTVDPRHVLGILSKLWADGGVFAASPVGVVVEPLGAKLSAGDMAGWASGRLPWRLVIAETETTGRNGCDSPRALPGHAPRFGGRSGS